jgi:hypothetical protein
MKVLGVQWINGRECIGLVGAINDSGEVKFYMKAVTGHDQERDIQEILDWGTSVDPESMQRFFGKCLLNEQDKS